MSRNLFNWTATLVIMSVWISVIIKAFRAYKLLMKSKNISLTEIRYKSADDIKDPETRIAFISFKKTTKRLFLTWLLTAVIFIIVSMLIDRTIGFVD